VLERSEQGASAASGGPPPGPGTGGGPATTGTIGTQLDGGGSPDTTGAAWSWLGIGILGYLLGASLLAVITLQIAGLLTGHADEISALAHAASPPTWYVVGTLVGLWCGFLGAAWLVSRVRGTGRPFDDLGIRFRWIDLLGVPVGLAGQLLVTLLYVPISHHVHDFTTRFDAPSKRLTGGSHGGGYALIAVLTVVGAPLVEEIFFRGLVLRSLARLTRRLGRRTGPVVAVVVTGLLFGLVHGEPLQFAGLAVFGMLLAAVAWRTGRIGMGVVAHASFNALALAAVVLPATAWIRPWA
jgi:membrane protease YdiL (CAAX protease family)